MNHPGNCCCGKVKLFEKSKWSAMLKKLNWNLHREWLCLPNPRQEFPISIIGSFRFWIQQRFVGKPNIWSEKFSCGKSGKVVKLTNPQHFCYFWGPELTNNSWRHHQQLKWDYNAGPTRNTVSILYNVPAVRWGSNASIMTHLRKRLLAYLTHNPSGRLWRSWW